jgi:hypothetical protein
MIESLKTFVPLAKEFSGLDLPDWIRGVLATFLFLAVLVVGCGFAYFVCAIYELPTHLQAELTRSFLGSANLVTCGLDSLMTLVHIVIARNCITDFVVYTLIWFLIMGALGYFTYIDRYLAPFLEGRFYAHVFKLSEEKKEKLKAWWKEACQKEEFNKEIEKLDAIRMTTKAGVIMFRSILIAFFLVIYVSLLMVNVEPVVDLHRSTQALGGALPVESAAQKNPSRPLDLEEATEEEVDDFKLMSLSGVLLAWAVFRYSGANRLLRSSVLAVVLLNLFLVAARIGSVRGENLIQFQEVTVKTGRANSSALDGSNLLLYSMGSSIRVYSCESQRIVEANLESSDVILYGGLVKLRDICRRPAS